MKRFKVFVEIYCNLRVFLNQFDPKKYISFHSVGFVNPLANHESVMEIYP